MFFFSDPKKIESQNSCIWTTDPGGGTAIDLGPRLRSLFVHGKIPRAQENVLKLTFAHHENSHSSPLRFSFSQLFLRQSLWRFAALGQKSTHWLLCWCFARVVASHESMNSWSAFFLGGFGESFTAWTKKQPGSKVTQTWLCKHHENRVLRMHLHPDTNGVKLSKQVQLVQTGRTGVVGDSARKKLVCKENLKGSRVLYGT